MPVTLKKYQRKGVDEITRHKGRVLVADEMGLGKTVEALAWADENIAGTIVIICPAAVKVNWQREVLAVMDKESSILETRSPPRNITNPPPGTIVIINYDILSPWVDYLIGINPSLVILDECQHIRNPSTKRSTAAKKLCKVADYILALSGTPLTNNPADLHSVLKILWPEKIPGMWPFGLEYCQSVRKERGRWIYKGAKNLPKLHRKLKKLGMVRRLKKDVLKELPAKTRVVIPIRLNSKNRKEYLSAERDLVSWLAKQSKAKAIRAAKATQIAKLGYLKRLAAELKWKQVEEWLDDLMDSTEGKIVAFAVHKRILSAIRDRYGSKCVIVNGETPPRRRQELIDGFIRKKTCRLFAGNIQAVGVGVNGLQKASDIAVFLEMGWTPPEHTQAEDRLHRIGQNNSITCYYLIAENTVEETICNIVQKKQEIAQNAIDGLEDPDLNVFDLLTEAIRKRVSTNR